MIPGPHGPALHRLADAYYEHLFEKEAHRLGHHFANVASERWVALELAMVVNDCAAEVGLPGWSAVVERKQVDVTLVPPRSKPRELGTDAIYIEAKLADPGSVKGWGDIRVDVVGKGTKPRASVTVCFLIQPTCRGTTKQQAMTAARYAKAFDHIPSSPGVFTARDGQPLFLITSSPTFDVRWDKPVYDRWPEGYAAKVRVVWLGLPLGANY